MFKINYFDSRRARRTIQNSKIMNAEFLIFALCLKPDPEMVPENLQIGLVALQCDDVLASLCFVTRVKINLLRAEILCTKDKCNVRQHIFGLLLSLWTYLRRRGRPVWLMDNRSINMTLVYSDISRWYIHSFPGQTMPSFQQV